MTALFLESNVGNDNDWYLLIGLVQFIVGFIQVFGAAFRTIIALFTRSNLKNLGIYWSIVITYFLIWELFNYCDWNITIWIPVAWLIAIWYCVKIVFPKTETIKTAVKY